MAYYLCLRASEYASRTVVPRDDSHQFVSESVEFTCSGADVFVPRHRWSEVRNIHFTVQHAKYIKIGHGVPIWFSTDEDDAYTSDFLQLVYLWAHSTKRSNTDPFLSYRIADGTLHCLRYITLQAEIKESAVAFGLNPDWFNPHSASIGGPTAAAAAGEQKEPMMVYGRWKSVPTSLIYQGSSTKSNNRMLRLLTNSQLFTSDDIRHRILLAMKNSDQPTDLLAEVTVGVVKYLIKM